MAKAGARTGEVRRKTKETDIALSFAVDGSGKSEVDTGIAFLDHMLDGLARHGFFDLKVTAKGDLDVDQHHTVEDVGLVLGEAIALALGDKAGIRRFGDAICPLDEALVRVVVDIGGRPFFVYNVEIDQDRVGTFDTELIHDFLLALSNELGINLHVDMVRGRNAHHIIEATFKALAKALDAATQLEPRVQGVLSTKGMLQGRRKQG
jgi:imidazoleglycerol-phosphate dehydratase